MLKETSEDFRLSFLLEFTKELIKNSKTDSVYELENILKGRINKKLSKKEKDKDLSKVIKEIKSDNIKDNHIPFHKPFKIMERVPKRINPPRINPHPVIAPKPIIVQHAINNSPVNANVPVLRIPKIRLPPHLQYLKPIPTNIVIDMKKLNQLARDPSVTSIECNGPGKKIMVWAPGRKPTEIILNKEEIDEIIKNFSETAKIPLQEGIFKVVVGRFILSAIISDVIGSKFVIRKLFNYPSNRLY